MILNDEVNRVFITYKDRLTRFGYHYIETICKQHHVKIVVVNQKEKSVSIEEELTNDLMSLIASFSGKLYVQVNFTVYVRIKIKRLKIMANKEIDLELLKMLSEMASLPDKLTLEDIFEMA